MNWDHPKGRVREWFLVLYRVHLGALRLKIGSELLRKTTLFYFKSRLESSEAEKLHNLCGFRFVCIFCLFLHGYHPLKCTLTEEASVTAIETFRSEHPVDLSSAWSRRLTDRRPHLAVGINHWAQQFPGSSPSVHSDHPKNLEKSQWPDGWRGKDVSLSPRGQNRDGCDQNHDVCTDTDEKSGKSLYFSRVLSC